MSVAGAIIAGFVATAVFVVTSRLTTMGQMRMERYLATFFVESDHPLAGFILAFGIGGCFGLLYAVLWALEIGWPSYQYGLIFGIVQWVIVGLVLGSLPRIHGGIRTGMVPAPGPYMMNLLGPLGFLAGLFNHVLFGFCIAYFYQFFATRYG